jgi:hypothetical protein
MDTDQIERLRRGLSAIATEVEPVDLRDRALGTARRIRARRTAGVAVLAAGLAVAIAALPVALRSEHPPTPAPVGVTPEPTVLPTEAPDHSPDLGPFDDLTIVVPSWGTNKGCVTGTVHLRHGAYERDAAHRPVNVLSYVAADVDHDGTEDYVAQLMCGEGPENGGTQIVAFHRDGTPIGRVVGTQDGFAMMDYLQARPDGRIAVLVSTQYTDSGQDTVPNQWRTYAWQGNRFRQVDGPTTFPANPPAAVLSVEATSLPFRPVGDRYVGRMTVTVRNTGAVDIARLQLLLVLPSGIQPAGDGWDGCARRPSPDSTALVCIVPGPRAYAAIPLELTVLAKDRPTGQGEHYASIWHLPPFDGLVTYQQEDAVISIPSR